MAADRAAVVEEARAKVNLHLHVTGRREDGYHLLDSLVVFPYAADTLTAEHSEDLTLSIEGPFAAALAGEGDNLVLRAARALAAEGRGAALTLDKRLPVAAGLGGGSADAAAALRALNRLWELGHDAPALEAIGAGLGADVPVCVRSRPAVMAGIGELLCPAPSLPPLWMALVNPGVAVSTPAVFAARRGAFSEPAAPLEAADAAGVARWMAGTRNDLQEAAVGLHPEIAEALAALEARRGALVARMSGSGATCFALFETRRAAEAAAAGIAAERPGWWVVAAAA